MKLFKLNQHIYFSNSIPKKWWKASGIFLVCIALTVAVSFYTRTNLQEQVKREFNLVCTDIGLNLHNRLIAHAQLLRSSAGLFRVSDTIDRHEWKVFIEDARIDSSLPGIQGVGFSMIVPKDQLQQHIQNIRKEGFPDYTIRPAGDRLVYTSIIYLEPFRNRNLRAFGYDMFSELTRRKAMELARDSDMATLSGKVMLVQETKNDVQSGTLMYVPVYRNGMPIRTVEERRAAIRGWVYSPYRMNDLMRGILGRWDFNKMERIHLQVYDDSLAVSSLLFDSQSGDSAMSVKSSFDEQFILPVFFNSKKWVYVFSHHSDVPFFRGKVLIVFIGGLLISILVLLLALAWYNTMQHAESIAQKLGVALTESEAKFKLLFEGANDAIFILEGMRFKDCNEKTALIFNCTKKDLIGRSVAAFSPPKQPDGQSSETKGAALIEAVLHDQPRVFEWTHCRKDGTFFDAEVSLNKIEILGKPYVQAIVRDVTDSKQAKRALALEKKRLAVIIEGINEGTWEWNVQTGETIFNDRWANMIGYTLTDISPERINAWQQFTHPEDLKRSGVLLEKHFNGESDFYECEVRMKHKKGHWVWVLDRGAINERDENGKALLMSGTHQDITERKRAESILEESEKRFRFMADTAPVLIWTSGTDTLCNYFNQTWLDFTGKSIEQEMGNGWAKGVHPDDLQGCLDIYLNAFKAQQEFKMEYRLLHVDGTYHWLWDNGVPRFTSDGLFVGYIGSCIDITKRKQAEENTARAALRYETLMQTASDGIHVLDEQGRVIEVNEAFCLMLGYTKAELMQMKMADWDIKFSDKELAEKISTLINQPDIFETRHQTKDGMIYDAEISVSTLTLDGENLLYCSARNITDRKDQEKILLEKELKYHGFNEGEFVAVFLSEKGVCIGQNQAAERMFGYTPAEALGRYGTDWIVEADRPMVMKHMMEGYDEPYDAMALRKDGTTFPCSLGGKLMQYKGRSIRITSLTDISDRKHSELKLERSSVELEKINAELENFAYLASHDLQEPLRLVTSFLNLLEIRIGKLLDETSREYIGFALSGTERMRSLIRDLLVYSGVRNDKEVFSATNIKEILTYTTDLLRVDILGKSAVLTVGPMPVANVNKTLISQLFVNLVSNALKYQSDKKPEIEIGCTEEADQYIFYVQDNGIGIAPAYKEKIFIIFQRLHDKSLYSGTGIGLAICKKVIDIHKGKIWVESEEGKGSTFYFTIPK